MRTLDQSYYNKLKQKANIKTVKPSQQSQKKNENYEFVVKVLAVSSMFLQGNYIFLKLTLRMYLKQLHLLLLLNRFIFLC